MSKKGPVHVTVSGFQDCPYFRKAVAAGEKVASENEDFTLTVIEKPRTQFHEHREAVLKQLGKSVDSHKTCPLVYTALNNRPMNFIGGCDSFLDFLRTEYPKTEL